MSRSSNERLDCPNVFAPPPFIFLGAFAAGSVLQALLPKRLLADTVPVRTFGGVLLVAGLALSALVIRHFRRAGTPVSPRHASRRLVVSGPYRFSRNPDYAGQALIVVGLGLLFDTPWVLIASVPALLIVRYGVVAREEEYLQARFGEEYAEYRRRVRRWF